MSSSLRSAEQQGSVPGPAASLGPGLTTSLPGPAVSAGSGPAASLSGPAASLPGPAVSAGSGPAASSGLEPAASSLPGPAASPGQGLRASVDLGPAASSGLKELRCLLGHIRYENLAAGLSGGVISTLVLHPLDLVKIRFAVSDGLQMRPQYYGMAHCMRSIWQVEGFRGLYQGVTPNVWGAGASWGFYFLFYNAIKSYCQEGRQTELSALEHLLSAAEAGILTLCLTNPVWVTKTRLVLQYSDRKQYNGMMDAMLKIYQYEGIPGLYRGFLPGLLGTSQAALQFTTYEALKRNNNQYKKLPTDALLSPWEYVVMAAVSKIIAVATTYPYQVVRARLQDQHNSYNGLADVVTRTWSNEGALGFYKGMVPNLVRVLPACCITFLVYENVSRLLLGQYK